MRGRGHHIFSFYVLLDVINKVVANTWTKYFRVEICSHWKTGIINDSQLRFRFGASCWNFAKAWLWAAKGIILFGFTRVTEWLTFCADGDWNGYFNVFLLLGKIFIAWLWASTFLFAGSSSIWLLLLFLYIPVDLVQIFLLEPEPKDIHSSGRLVSLWQNPFWLEPLWRQFPINQVIFRALF